MSNSVLFGNLYSDERDEVQLDSYAQKHFNKYLEKLAVLERNLHQPDNDNISAWQEWEYGLRQLYKEMILDAFEACNVKIPPGMEIHFAGSLAKAQATQYSDLDAFVLVENEEDIELVQPVFDALNNLCQRMFTATNQLYPDPIGINPSRLIGTPESLYEKLQEGGVLDAEATVRSLVSSKPIFLPRYELGEQLCNKIKNDPVLGAYCSAQKLYSLAIHDFTAPSPNASNVSVKTHIMRPLDFILMGMRTEFGLYQEDGGHLSGLGTIRLLREKKLLPEADLDRIETLCNKAMTKRFQLHAEHKSEHDDMPYAEAEEMLAEVAWLRGIAAQRLQELNAPRPEAPSPEKIPGFFARNAGVFKGMAVMTTAFVAAVAIGLGLGLIGSGIMAPLVSAGGAVAGVAVVPAVLLAVGTLLAAAVVGYSLYKGIQAISNWFSAKSDMTPEIVNDHENDNMTNSYSGPMSQLVQDKAATKNVESNPQDVVGYNNVFALVSNSEIISSLEEPRPNKNQATL
ncbi:hypothetical protein J2N86_12925 [Legionella lytica]|uniref:SidM N-terminal domain-containing protein n=1 Tax=Legionella lytica TaxID=96232 RepID=A0ABY4Y863_9GAMM|nr:hypothetical protein [Legionella lytica]USQ13568.1 hypothetical protein J2N86_12925 [Legionella lytica]